MVEFTPAFWRWFGKSKVVDKNGEPLVVYHGTPAGEFNVFKMPAFFTSSLEDVDFYHHGSETAFTHKVYLRIERPLVLEVKDDFFRLFDIAKKGGVEIQIEDRKGGWSFYAPEIEKYSPYSGENNAFDMLYIPAVRRELIQCGYDGVTGLDVMSNYEIQVYIPMTPPQIKSVENDGTFDADDPDITSNPYNPRRRRRS